MTITLKINGTAFEGWKLARVSRGVDRAAGDFDLTISDRFPLFEAGENIKAGDECTIEVNGQPVITGYVDEVSPSYDADTHEYSVRGRSKTCDLIDCSAMNKPGQWKGLPLLDIAKAIAAPFGIEVSVAGKEQPETVKDFQIQQGETAFNAIERLCRLQGFLASDDEQGNLVIARAGSDSGAGTIQCTPIGIGNNVLEGSATYNVKDRFSDYIVKGQQAGSDDIDGDTARGSQWSLKDGNVRRYRPLLTVAEGQTNTAGARKRAAWERSTRAGKSIQLNYRVQGWTASEGGGLWRINSLVPVKDAMLGVEGEYLLAEVSFSISDSGSTTELRLTPKEAYTPEPTEDIKEKSKTSASVSSWADDEGDE
jgi:prophage tail gpP-like protein